MVCAWPLGPLRSGGSNNILMQQPVSTARVCRQEASVLSRSEQLDGDAVPSRGRDVQGSESHGRQARRFQSGGWTAVHRAQGILVSTGL